MIEQVKTFAADLKGRNASRGVLDPDSGQVAAVAEQERPYEDISGLVVLDWDHLLFAKIDFWREMQ